jgi:glucan 1,3-beta-glucosidase
LWLWQGAGGILFSIIVFGAAIIFRTKDTPLRFWLAVTIIAIAGGALVPWTIENIPVESLGVAGWARSLALAAVAISAPVVVGVAIMCGTPVPAFFRMVGPKDQRMRNPLALLTGTVLVSTMLLAFVIALGLVFDPRYRDFPFAPLTAAVFPFLVHGLMTMRPKGVRPAAEFSGGCVLALSVCYIVFNEGLANWQSLWVCGVLAVLAVILVRVRDVPG